MRIIWETPPDIRQRSNDTCWAAVLEAFCRTSPGRPKLDQNDLFTEFSSLCNSELDHKMPLNSMRRMFADPRFGLEIEEVSNAFFKSSPSFVFKKLAAGMIIVGYWEPKTNGWHVVLVYGIDETKLLYMNPDAPDGGLLTDDIAYFASRGNILVASRRW